MWAVGRAVLQVEQIGPDQFVSRYPIEPFGQTSELPAAPAEIIEKTGHLRFDPVSACNARCVFCHTNFDLSVQHLTPEDLAAVVAHPMPLLQTIAVGCAYEPLMSKHFENFPAALQRFKGQAKARIITNGSLLHRRDIGPWVDFGLEYLHLSIHSHLPKIYANTMKNIELAQVTRNVAATRDRFPGIRVLFLNVISKRNDVDIRGYCRWAFDEMGADRVVLVRCVLSEMAQNGSPSHTFAQTYFDIYGRSAALTDAEWQRVIDACSEFLGASHCSVAPGPGDTDISSLTINRPQAQ